MSDWEFIKMVWSDKRALQQDCLALAVAIFMLIAWALFLFALDGLFALDVRK